MATQRSVNAVVGSVEQIRPGLGLFDTVLLLGNNLGLLASAERRRCRARQPGHGDPS